MKKIISAFLLPVILLCAVSCGTGDGASEGTSSDITIPEPSEASVITEESSEPVTVNMHIAELDAVLGEEPDRSLGFRNVLLGKKYTASRAYDDAYADADAVKLTDGITVEDFNRYSWVGYSGGGPVTLNFDIGKVQKGIADIEIGTFRKPEYAIGTPRYVELYTSVDGESYTMLSRLYAPVDMLDTQKYVFRFALHGTVSARYIRIEFSSQDSGFLFLDEVTAIVYDGIKRGDTENPDYYGCSLPEYSELYWENPTDKKENLALYADTYFFQSAPIPVDSCSDYVNTLPANSTLNDGSYGGTASWDSPSLTRFTRGDARDVIFDLGRLSAVSGIRGAVLSQPEWGVNAPVSIVICMSENGTDRQGMDIIYPESDGTARFINFSSDFSKTYIARFVKFSFSANPHVAFSELEIIGTKAIPENAAQITRGDKTESFAGTYLYPEYADGMHNIVCTPICSGTADGFDFSYGMNTADDYLYYVGYYENGVPVDTFMDNFLISPTSSYISEEHRRTLVGWKHYIDSEFLPGYNIPALNDAVKSVSDALQLTDYSVGVFLSIMRSFECTDDEKTVINTFGDIDGDGKDDAFTDTENRKKALRWMIDTQLEKFNAGNFSGLKLRGFYWQEESIIADDAHEIELLRYAADYIHSLGYKLLWIPYYNATGYNMWNRYGIDYACFQPNYSFMSSSDDFRLDKAARLAGLHGMCVEIECADADNSDNVVKYKQYLEAGVKYGYMNALKVYYLDVLPGELKKALSNKSEYIRSIYRDTYLFAKEKLDGSYRAVYETEHTAAEDTTVSVAPGKQVRGKITVNTEDDYTPLITELPKYGYLRFNLGGTFTYTAPDNFTGTDTFSVRCKYADGLSAESTVTVVIEKPEDS